MGRLLPLRLAIWRARQGVWPLARLSAITGLSRRQLGAFCFTRHHPGSTIILWTGRSRSAGLASGEGVVLKLHGSNTIGAKLAPALAEEYLKSLGAKEIHVVTGRSPEEATVEGVLPGHSVPSVIEIRSHGSATAFTDL
jgi:hypothetical protein